MEEDVKVDAVERLETRSGKTRWVLRTADGREFTTFRPRIGEEAERHQGRRAHISFHEEERNGFQNVYLDAISPAVESDTGAAAGDGGDSDPDEVAWNTAVEAAPWLLGTSEPEKAIEPDELYETLEPFKRRVSEDIRHHGDSDDG
jgi:hypothetical protein